jgi:hypothetical protein
MCLIVTLYVQCMSCYNLEIDVYGQTNAIQGAEYHLHEVIETDQCYIRRQKL